MKLFDWHARSRLRKTTGPMIGSRNERNIVESEEQIKIKDLTIQVKSLQGEVRHLKSFNETLGQQLVAWKDAHEQLAEKLVDGVAWKNK